MDFDLKGHILYAREGFEELKERILDTVDLLQDWYGLSQFEYAILSGVYNPQVGEFRENTMNPNSDIDSPGNYDGRELNLIIRSVQIPVAFYAFPTLSMERRD
jgi:hypothetical protein